MEKDILLFLLGYPIGIIANISTDYLSYYSQKTDINPFKKLFIKSFVKSLDIRKKQIDTYGQETILKIKKEIKSNPEKLFHIINSLPTEGCASILDFRDEKIKQRLAEIIIRELNISEKENEHIVLAIIKDCLNYYELAFFANMTEKQGIRILLSIMKKINAEIVKKKDFDELREFISRELLNRPQHKKINLDALMSGDIKELILYESSFPENQEFSNSIKNHMALLKKNIQKLTNEQFQIIQYLRYHQQVMIAGCAGSGKTLIASEKAIRLDNAGIKTLILCHNPFLANHIRGLVSGTGVIVSDFCSFIDNVLEKNNKSYDEWSEYHEPIYEDVDKSFNKILNSQTIIDAIIVDEAQDFRDEWWMVIEAALESSSYKILYIFYDDNQSLLPFRSSFTFNESPFLMSKNCRNGGEIFKLVSKFHPQSPEVSNILKGSGFLKISTIDTNNIENIISEVFRETLKHTPIEQIVALTAEPYSLANSVLNSFKFVVDLEYGWQSAINKDLFFLKRNFLNRIKQFSSHHDKVRDKLQKTFVNPKINLNADWDINLPTFSEGWLPGKDDINKVKKFVNTIVGAFSFDTPFHSEGIQWHKGPQGLTSRRVATTNHPSLKLSFQDKLGFYSSNKWYQGLPDPTTYEVIPVYEHRFNGRTIPLYPVSAFKGLEADAVILLVNSLSYEQASKLYVGISRAVGYLHIIIDKKTLSAFHQFNEYLH